VRPHPHQVAHVHFAPASPDDEARGLLGFVSLQLGSLFVGGVALRRSRQGRLWLSWPAPRGFPLVRPLDERARRSIEAQVFAALGLQEART